FLGSVIEYHQKLKWAALLTSPVTSNKIIIPTNVDFKENIDVNVTYNLNFGSEKCPGAPKRFQCKISPLMFLADNRLYEELKHLVQSPQGKQQDIINFPLNDLTPLMIAVKSGNIELIKNLLAWGADRDIGIVSDCQK